MRQTGTVKWFDPEKGYGFITPTTKGDPDVFVHWSGIRRSLPGQKGTLTDGARVEYAVISDPKNGKPKADDVVQLLGA